MVQLGAFALRPSDLGTAQLLALLNIPDHRVFHLSPMLGQQLAQGQLKIPCPPDSKDLVPSTKIRCGLLDNAAQLFKDRPLRLQNYGHLRVDRQPAQGRTPGDARSRKRTLQVLAEQAARLIDRLRRPRVGSGQDAQQQGRILHRSGHRSLDRKRKPGDPVRPGRHPARRRAQADHVAETGRIAQRAAQIAAVRQRQHTAGQGHGRSAAAAAAGFAQVIRVARRAKHRVIGL